MKSEGLCRVLEHVDVDVIVVNMMTSPKCH